MAFIYGFHYNTEVVDQGFKIRWEQAVKPHAFKDSNYVGQLESKVVWYNSLFLLLKWHDHLVKISDSNLKYRANDKIDVTKCHCLQKMT